MALKNKDGEYYRITGLTYKVDEKILVIEIQSWPNQQSRQRGETKYEKPVLSNIVLFVEDKIDSLLRFSYERIKVLSDFEGFSDV